MKFSSYGICLRVVWDVLNKESWVEMVWGSGD